MIGQRESGSASVGLGDYERLVLSVRLVFRVRCPPGDVYELVVTVRLGYILEQVHYRFQVFQMPFGGVAISDNVIDICAQDFAQRSLPFFLHFGVMIIHTLGQPSSIIRNRLSKAQCVVGPWVRCLVLWKSSRQRPRGNSPNNLTSRKDQRESLV